MRKHITRAALAAALGLATALAPAAEPDWAQLATYRAANAALAHQPADPERVVFMGDSITEGWASLADNPHYVNRGISGQTTAQMLVRFRADVLALKPRLVVLLAGTNDIAGNTGKASVDEIAGHLRSMVQLARAEGVRVVLCSLLPVKAYPWSPEVRPVPQVAALNRQLQALARQYGAGWVDYFSPLADREKGLPQAYSGDGVHPNDAAYRVMRGLVDPVIAQQLRPHD